MNPYFANWPRYLRGFDSLYSMPQKVRALQSSSSVMPFGWCLCMANTWFLNSLLAKAFLAAWCEVSGSVVLALACGGKLICRWSVMVCAFLLVCSVAKRRTSQKFGLWAILPNSTVARFCGTAVCDCSVCGHPRIGMCRKSVQLVQCANLMWSQPNGVLLPVHPSRCASCRHWCLGSVCTPSTIAAGFSLCRTLATVADSVIFHITKTVWAHVRFKFWCGPAFRFVQFHALAKGGCVVVH